MEGSISDEEEAAESWKKRVGLTHSSEFASTPASLLLHFHAQGAACAYSNHRARVSASVPPKEHGSPLTSSRW